MSSPQPIRLLDIVVVVVPLRLSFCVDFVSPWHKWQWKIDFMDFLKNVYVSSSRPSNITFLLLLSAHILMLSAESCCSDKNIELSKPKWKMMRLEDECGERSWFNGKTFITSLTWRHSREFTQKFPFIISSDSVFIQIAAKGCISESENDINLISFRSMECRTKSL